MAGKADCKDSVDGQTHFRPVSQTNEKSARGHVEDAVGFRSVVLKEVQEGNNVVDGENDGVQDEPQGYQLQDDKVDGVVRLGMVLHGADYQQTGIRQRPDNVQNQFQGENHRQLKRKFLSE